MAIYDIKHYVKPATDEKKEEQKSKATFKDKLFSTLAARLFFMLLLIADLFWGALSIAMTTLYLVCNIVSGFKVAFLQKRLAKAALSLRRSLVCLVALCVALISPALGIMFACSYFLMFDKEGIEEVVPSSLKDQFKAFQSDEKN